MRWNCVFSHRLPRLHDESLCSSRDQGTTTSSRAITIIQWLSLSLLQIWQWEIRTSIRVKRLTQNSKNGQVSNQGKHYSDLGHQSKFNGSHVPCPHSHWTWRDRWDRKKTKIIENPSPSKFGDKNMFCSNKYLVEIEAIRNICIQSPQIEFVIEKIVD